MDVSSSDPQRYSHWPTWPTPFKLEPSHGPSHPCPYFPHRRATMRAFMCMDVPAWGYQALMHAGYRRSGKLFYQPACEGCRRCVPLRVPVDGFAPSKRQRRAAARNRDLHVTEGEPEPTAEKHEVYRRYVLERHNGIQPTDYASMCEFLYDSPTQTVEFTYRDQAGKLIGVGICDVVPDGMSTVYFYFDPDESRRSLGVASALYEIDWVRQNDRAYYYLGYWVYGCSKMDYKAEYQPCEILCTDGEWRPLEHADPRQFPAGG